MGDRKGKSRAVPDDEEASTTIDVPPQHLSILSRVATSARGLTRSAFATPTSDEVSNLATVTALSSVKGRLPEMNAAPEVWGESSKQQHMLNRTPGGVAFVRNGQIEEHLRKSESDFATFLDGIDSFASTNGAKRSHFSNDNFTTNTEVSGVTYVQNSRNLQPIEKMSVSEQESHDGVDVLAILSGASADDEDFTILLEEGDKHDWGMSPEQLSHLKVVTRELFPEIRTYGEVAPHNPLNLIPDFQSGSSSQLSGLPDSIALYQWTNQWESVLTRYTDEVWGGLLPLVKDARQEIRDDDDQKISNTRALRRLEAILGHLQGR